MFSDTGKFSIRLAPLVVSFVCLLSACGGGNSSGQKTIDDKHLVVQGSDTMHKMVGVWATAFMKNNPQVRIDVQNGDTGSGVESLIDGKIDVAAASRELADDEQVQAHDKGVHLLRTMVAKDALALIVSTKNPLKVLTMVELKEIFGGKIKNWSEIKSNPELKEQGKITVLGREASSGTGDYLRSHVLEGQPFGDNVKLEPTTGAVIDVVEKDTSAIGFVGLSHAMEAGDKIKIVKLLLDATSPRVADDITITGADYPLSRPLYLYCNSNGKGSSKQFVEFCSSAEGQKIAKELGFMPLH